jgi:hypothetical protein
MPRSANQTGEPLLEGAKEAKKKADTRPSHQQSTESEQNPSGKEEAEPDARFVDSQAITRLELVRHIVPSFLYSDLNGPPAADCL